MKPNEYIAKIKEFVVVPEEHMEAYLTTLLASEAGECLGLYGKYLRGDFGTDRAAYKDKMLKEFGDVCFGLCLLADRWNLPLNWGSGEFDYWAFDEEEYLIDLCARAVETVSAYRNPDKASMIYPVWNRLTSGLDFYGFTLEQVMEANIEKLEARKAKGTIRGSGERE